MEVRKPATMPGGSSLEALASLISDSSATGAKATAALMQAVHALEAQPRIYEVRIFTQRCSSDGHRQVDGAWLHITVDLRDTRTGQNVAVRMLPPCPPDEAAKRVAGFTARQVFEHDHSTPAWAVGSADGQDLCAYLLADEISPRSRAFSDVYDCRQRQRRLLDSAVRQSRNAGLVQYELAALCDIDGDNLESLRLHLDNRVGHPRFLRGRNRLAMSLSMLADPVFDSQWRTGRAPAGRDAAGRGAAARALLKEEIIRKLGWAGLLGGLGEPAIAEPLAGFGDPGIAELLGDPNPAGDREKAVKLALLTIARLEFCACQKSSQVRSLLWSALRHRAERRLMLEMLRARPGWVHPRRRMLASRVALEVIDQRLNRVRDPASADARLESAQHRVLHLLGLHQVLQTGAPWDYHRVPWQAVYCAACLHALRKSSGLPDPASADVAVRLLRLAVSDPECELVRPSEWIGMDPDLRSLRGFPSFDAFVREQACWDFAPSPGSSAGDPWFRQQLPGTRAGGRARAGASRAQTAAAVLPRESPDPAALVPPQAPPVSPADHPAAARTGRGKARHRIS